MLGRTLLCAAIGLAIRSGGARAELVYDMQVTGATYLSNGDPSPFQDQFRLFLLDSAEADGGASFSTASSNGVPPGIPIFVTPDSDFVALTATLPGSLLNNAANLSATSYLSDSVEFTVDPTGYLSSGVIDLNDEQSNIDLTLSDGSFSGTFLSDGGGACYYDPGCSVSGTYTTMPVPEPSSFAILAVGALGIASAGRQVLRRRRRPA